MTRRQTDEDRARRDRPAGSGPRPDFTAQDPWRHVVAGRKAIGALLLGLIILAMALVVLLSGRAAAQDLRFLRIATASPAGTYFQIGGMIASAISGPPGAPDCTLGGSCGVPGLIAVAVSSEGSLENLRWLQDGRVEAALVQSDVAYWAESGTGPFEGQPIDGTIRAIGRLYVEQLHLVVRAESAIQTLADLAGHSVSLGAPGSGTLVLVEQLLDAAGLAPDDMTISYLRPDDAADRMTEGALDAFFAIGGAPVLAISDLAARVPVRLVPIEGADVVRMVYDQPFLSSAIIAPRSYEGVGVTRTIGVTALLVVSADLDEETVYRMTRALWHPTTTTYLAAGHPRGREIRLGDALVGVPIAIHPGARAFYDLVGMGGSRSPSPPLRPEATPAPLDSARALLGN